MTVAGRGTLFGRAGRDLAEAAQDRARDAHDAIPPLDVPATRGAFAHVGDAGVGFGNLEPDDTSARVVDLRAAREVEQDIETVAL